MPLDFQPDATDEAPPVQELHEHDAVCPRDRNCVRPLLVNAPAKLARASVQTSTTASVMTCLNLRGWKGAMVASYYTMPELRAKSGGLTAAAAQQRLRSYTRYASGTYDVFLSHSFHDAQAILGLHGLLTEQGLRVYVDWIDDPELDRSRVSPSTAARLRERMKSSRSLVYATSQAARNSRWMPWELGYFDGIRDGSRVSILPVEDGVTAFNGEEYLGLYKVIEKRRVSGVLRPYAVRPSGRQAESVVSFAKGQDRFIDLVTR